MLCGAIRRVYQLPRGPDPTEPAIIHKRFSVHRPKPEICGNLIVGLFHSLGDRNRLRFITS